jgi:hypothetical protein
LFVTYRTQQPPAPRHVIAVRNSLNPNAFPLITKLPELAELVVHVHALAYCLPRY